MNSILRTKSENSIILKKTFLRALYLQGNGIAVRDDTILASETSVSGLNSLLEAVRTQVPPPGLCLAKMILARIMEERLKTA